MSLEDCLVKGGACILGLMPLDRKQQEKKANQGSSVANKMDLKMDVHVHGSSRPAPNTHSVIYFERTLQFKFFFHLNCHKRSTLRIFKTPPVLTFPTAILKFAVGFHFFVNGGETCPRLLCTACDDYIADFTEK